MLSMSSPETEPHSRPARGCELCVTVAQKGQHFFPFCPLFLYDCVVLLCVVGTSCTLFITLKSSLSKAEWCSRTK